MIMILYIVVSVFVAGNSASNIYNELQLYKASCSTAVFQFVVFFWLSFFLWPLMIFIKK